MKKLIRLLYLGASFGAVLAGSAHAEMSDNDRTLYRQAYTWAQAGTWDAAWAAARQAKDPFPSKLLRWIELTRGGPKVRFPDLADFITNNPEWPSQLLLRQRAEEALASETDTTAANWFAHNPPVTPTGKEREAELWIAGGKLEAGVNRLREIWVNTNFSLFDEKTFLQRYSNYLRTADHEKRLDRLIWDSKSPEAERMLMRVGVDYRALGQARLALADNDGGAERLISRVPAALQRDPGLLYERMRWRRRKEHYDDAIDILDHPPTDLVRPLAWATERQVLARIALSENNVPLAYRLASRHGLTNGPAFADLEFFAGWTALRFSHEAGLGYDHFVKLYDQSKLPVTKARGAYWAARAAAELGQTENANSWYGKAAEFPTSYYGQWSAAAIGEASLSRIQPEPVPPAEEITSFESRDLVRAARDLVVIGDPEDLRPFLIRLADQAVTPGDYIMIGRLAMALDRPDLALFAARKASTAGMMLFSESYPLVQIPAGTAEGALVLAMARQESAFDQEAVSSAGARGLMQLMPETAKKVAKSLNLPFSEAQLTQDRTYNMRLGHAYLDSLLTDFSGSYVLAIAAYNAGPSRVHQWLSEYGDPRTKGTDVIDWVEAVPVSETRNYLQRVLENLQIYRLRLGDRDLAFKLASDLKR